MALDPELLDLLVCPETREKLTPASTSLVEKLNGAVTAGELKNRAGNAIDRPLQGGLVRPDGKVVYPVWDDIPDLIIDDAIPLDGID